MVVHFLNVKSLVNHKFVRISNDAFISSYSILPLPIIPISGTDAVSKSYVDSQDMETLEEAKEYVNSRGFEIKTVSIGNLPNASTIKVAHNLTAEEYNQVIHFFGIATTVAGQLYPIPWVDPNSLTSGIAVFLDSVSINVRCASNQSSVTGVVYIFIRKS